MKKFLLLIVILLGAGAVYAGLSYHFILFDNNLKILKKTDRTFTNTFVDARGPQALKLLLKPDLVRAGVKELLGQSQGLKVPTPGSPSTSP